MDFTPMPGRERPEGIASIRSLAYRTDAMVYQHAGAVLTQKPGVLLLRAPEAPDQDWRNLALFSSAPRPGDEKRWPEVYAREFGSEAQRIVMGWDDPLGTYGQIMPFVEAGYQIWDFVVLTARKVKRPRAYSPDVEVRPIESARDWDTLLHHQLRSRGATWDAQEYTRLKQPQLSAFQRLCEQGRGRWFGGYLGQELVGSLGLFVQDGIGRILQVGRSPGKRETGLTRTLVYQAARSALSEMGAKLLVILAGRYQSSSRAYQSLGFIPTERQVGLTLRREAASQP